MREACPIEIALNLFCENDIEFHNRSSAVVVEEVVQYVCEI